MYVQICRFWHKTIITNFFMPDAQTFNSSFLSEHVGPDLWRFERGSAPMTSSSLLRTVPERDGCMHGRMLVRCYDTNDVCVASCPLLAVDNLSNWRRSTRLHRTVGVFNPCKCTQDWQVQDTPARLSSLSDVQPLICCWKHIRWESKVIR